MLAKYKKRLLLMALIFPVLVTGAFQLALYLTPSAREMVENFHYSPSLFDDKNRLFHVRPTAEGEWILPVPLEKMGPWLPVIAVAVEDKRFYQHPGIDPWALARAAKQNIAKGRVVSGASTITSQLIRLSVPRERTFSNKVKEFGQALKLEQELPKDAILEYYLNRASFGGTIRGVEAAARIYFFKSAKELSLGESALLVALLRGPTLYRPDKRPHLTKERRDLILDILAQKGLASPEQVTAAKEEPIYGRLGRMPIRAWHFSDIALKKAPAQAFIWHWGQRAYGLSTTLNLDMQDLLEVRLNLGLSNFPRRITGAAALIDNQSQGVLAYVGNARQNESLRTHWVDCAQARRSPGSALKPFIFLKAIEEGLLAPEYLLADTPLNLSGRAPRNFDETYRGPVSVRRALADSLNAPSVRVLKMVGYQDSLVFLRNLGFSFLNDNEAHYGDSLIIGGGEVSLMQLLAAYSSLARLGSYHEPLFLPDSEAAKNSPPLFSPGAAFLISDILKDEGRLAPQLRMAWESNELGPVAFKTGTSYGLRDAWVAAYNPQYSLVVWLGDQSGAGYSGLIGLRAAGPVALSFFRDVLKAQPKKEKIWFTPPPEVEFYQACQLSGRPVGAFCPTSQPARRLAKVAQTLPCELHTRTNGVVAVRWPAELADFAAQHPDSQSSKTTVKILAPAPGSRIFMAPGPAVQKIPLRSEGAVGQVHWFVDDEFFAESQSAITPMWAMAPGRHVVTLIDAEGRTAKSEFKILVLGGIKEETNRYPILELN